MRKIVGAICKCGKEAICSTDEHSDVWNLGRCECGELYGVPELLKMGGRVVSND